jgi:hypothetical protein
MPIENNNPITIPATEEKTFPHWWVQSIHVSTPSPTKAGHANITICPYNSTTQEVFSSSRESIIVDNIWDEAQAKPEVAAAINAIIEAVNVLKNSQS